MLGVPGGWKDLDSITSHHLPLVHPPRLLLYLLLVPFRTFLQTSACLTALPPLNLLSQAFLFFPCPTPHSHVLLCPFVAGPPPSLCTSCSTSLHWNITQDMVVARFQHENTASTEWMLTTKCWVSDLVGRGSWNHSPILSPRGMQVCAHTCLPAAGASSPLPGLGCQPQEEGGSFLGLGHGQKEEKDRSVCA